jgi:hypothetical protein
MYSKILLFVLFGLVVLSTGCKRSGLHGLVDAEGVVFYKGKPLDGAVVSIAPKVVGTDTRNSAAQTDAEGRFALRTLGIPGALPGNYFVSVTKHVPKTAADYKKIQAQESAEEGKEAGADTTSDPAADLAALGKGQPEYKHLLPKKYTNPRQSGIEITIGSKGEKELKIEITD